MVLLLVGAFFAGVFFVGLILGLAWLLRHRIGAWRDLWWARHGQALKEEWKGHGVVAEVEMTDGTLQYIGADILDEEATIQLREPFGMKYKIHGNGGEPVFMSGVPIIRCWAWHAAPVDTKLAVAMAMDEDGDYERVDEDGNTVEDGASDGPETSATPEAPATPDGNGASERAVTDGGTEWTQTTAAAEQTRKQVEDREYDFEPDSGTHGHVFSLTDAIHRVPFSITPQDLKFQEERGKESASVEGSRLGDFLRGMVTLLGILILLLIIGIAAYHLLGLGGGGGGGGGGGQNVNGILLLFLAAGRRLRLARPRQALLHRSTTTIGGDT